MPEDRIWLPSVEVADAWGVPGWRGGDGGVRVTSESVCGVEAVFAVPGRVLADSRVLVLLGGRTGAGTA